MINRRPGYRLWREKTSVYLKLLPYFRLLLWEVQVKMDIENLVVSQGVESIW